MVPTPTGIGKYYKIPGTVKLLFETPSGFAIFSFDEKYLKKSIEHIWAFFVGNYWHKNIVWLHEFRAFEDKPNVFNLTAQTIDVSLVKMLGTHCGWDETLVVGSRGYKDIIEKRMGLNCLFDDAVKEVMWGLQNLMHTLVPQEQSKITKDDRLPMSLGLNMVLNRYKINVTQEMLNEHIIKKTSKLYATDLREKRHLMFLHKMFDGDFKEFSKVDSKSWCLSKIATALKIMFDPDGALKFGNPHKMFSHDELTIFSRDAHLYQLILEKDLILAVYHNTVTLREGRAELLYELRCLVEQAKAALETEEVQEKPATNGVDSKDQVDRTCVTVDLTVLNRSSIGEVQHSRITEAVGEDILPPTNGAVLIDDNVHTSSIFSVAPQVVPGDQGTEGRKRAKGMESVDNLEDKEQAENSSEEQMNAVLVAVGNDRTEVETTANKETKQCGDATVKQGEALNAGIVEGEQAAVIQIVDSLGEKDRTKNSSEEQRSAILDGAENDTTSVEMATTVGNQPCVNVSVMQNEALSVNNFEEKQQVESSSEEQMNAVLFGSGNDRTALNAGSVEGEKAVVIQTVDSLGEKEQTKNSSEEQRSAILDGAENKRAAVGMATAEGNQPSRNVNVKQSEALNERRVEGKRTEDTSEIIAVQSDDLKFVSNVGGEHNDIGCSGLSSGKTHVSLRALLSGELTRTSFAAGASSEDSAFAKRDTSEDWAFPKRDTSDVTATRADPRDQWTALPKGSAGTALPKGSLPAGADTSNVTAVRPDPDYRSTLFGCFSCFHS